MARESYRVRIEFNWDYSFVSDERFGTRDCAEEAASYVAARVSPGVQVTVVEELIQTQLEGRCTS